jgi:hypothetical protein
VVVVVFLVRRRLDGRWKVKGHFVVAVLTSSLLSAAGLRVDIENKKSLVSCQSKNSMEKGFG